SPPMKIKSSMPRIPSGMMKSIFTNLLPIFNTSCFRRVVVNALQLFAKMEHRVAFTGKQSVHANSGAGGDLLEAEALDFMRDEYFALLRRQLGDRKFKC